MLGELNLKHINVNKDKSKWMFPIVPDSNFKISWDMMGLLLIIYQAVLIPYRFCFKVHAVGYLLVIETFIDGFFIVDICKLNISFRNSGVFYNDHYIMYY